MAQSCPSSLAYTDDLFQRIVHLLNLYTFMWTASGMGATHCQTPFPTPALQVAIALGAAARCRPAQKRRPEIFAGRQHTAGRDSPLKGAGEVLGEGGGDPRVAFNESATLGHGCFLSKQNFLFEMVVQRGKGKTMIRTGNIEHERLPARRCSTVGIPCCKYSFP